MQLVQTMLGYDFRDVIILIDALSLKTLESERLEFVGDAALDLVAVSFWNTLNPAAGRRAISERKSASTCNQFLGMVYIELDQLP